MRQTLRRGNDKAGRNAFRKRPVLAAALAAATMLGCAPVKKPEHPAVRAASTQRTKRDKKFEKLVRKLKADRPCERENAIVEFALLKDAQAVPHLIEVLKNDSSRMIQVAAATALGYIKDRSALRALDEIIRDNQDRFVNSAARDARDYIAGRKGKMHWKFNKGYNSCAFEIKTKGEAKR